MLSYNLSYLLSVLLSEVSDLFWTGFLASFGIVAIAEMGDKTQLSAMCFVAKYHVVKVLTGVFLATLANNILAVAAGYFLSEFLGKYSDYIQIIASLAFIGFGLWTLKADDGDDVCERPARFGPVFTVASAFFVAEMGDKTQLSVIALAAKFPSPGAVLLGAVSGMMLANTIGIAFGYFLHRKIPAYIFRMIAAAIFIIAGLFAFAERLSVLAGIPVMIAVTLAAAVITGFLAYIIGFRKKT